MRDPEIGSDGNADSDGPLAGDAGGRWQGQDPFQETRPSTPVVRRLACSAIDKLRLTAIVIGLGLAVGAGYAAPWLAALGDRLAEWSHPAADLFDVGVPVFMAGVVATLGIVLAGLALHSCSPHVTTKLSISWSRWRPGAVAVLVAAAALLAVVLARVSNRSVGLADLGLFFAALVLFGWTVHLLDGERHLPARFFFERGDWLIAGGFALAAGALASIHQTHWTFAWVGDEGAFYDVAKALAQGKTWNPFDLTVVYDSHPALDSLYQSVVMRLFGVNVVGWRLAEVLVLAASTALFYLLVRAVAGRLAAIVGAVILGSNHYLLAFAHIGYNNLHSVFWTELAVLMLVLAWRTGRAVFIYATGTAVGLCLYTFQVALLIGVVIAIVQGIAFLRAPSRRHVAAGLLMLGSFGITVSPGLMTTSLRELEQNAAANCRREAAARNPLSTHTMSTARTLTVFWDNPRWRDHYVVSALLDPVSGLLLGLGLVTALLHPRKVAERLALVWFLVGWIGVGFSAYTPNPFLTRILFLMPPAALLAGLATANLAGTVGWAAGAPRRLGMELAAVALMVIPALNAWQLYVIAPGELRYPRQVQAIRALQEYPGRTVLLVADNPDPHLTHLLERYPWLERRARFSNVATLDVTLQKIPPDGPHPVIVAYDRDLVEELRERLKNRYSLADPGSVDNSLPVLVAVNRAVLSRR